MADAQQEIPLPTVESGASTATLAVEASELSSEAPGGSAKNTEEPLLAEKEEEKVVETVEEKKVETVESGERELPAEGVGAVPSFKEESYHVADLKESEKKALDELKKKVEEAILSNAFAKRPKPEATRDVEAVKSTDDAKEKAESETKEGEAEVKTESEAKEGKTEVETKDEDVAYPSEEPPKEESPPAVSAEFPTPVEPIVAAAEIPVPASENSGNTETPQNAVVVDESAAPPASCVERGPGEETVVEVSTKEVTIEGEASPPPEDLDLWGVPLLHTKGDDRTDVLLLKFLRARDFKVNDALSMLKNTVIWRKEFLVDSVLEEEFGTDYSTVAYMHGCDKDGHPVCYNDYGIFQDKERYINTFGDETKFNRFLRWRIQVLEKSIQKLNFSPGSVHSMVQITDLKESPGFLKWRHITKKALTVLQDNYPEFVAKQIFINVPWYFNALYSIYGSFITSRQKSKVIAVRPGKVTEALFKHISPEHVPLKYGGLSRPNDSEFEAVEAPVKELIIKAGEKQIVELPVEESGARVVWDVAVVGWELVYGEEFVPTSESGYTVIVQKSKKVPPSEGPMRNTFKVTEPGKIVLTIDNSASRRKKHAVYRYVVKKTISIEN